MSECAKNSVACAPVGHAAGLLALSPLAVFLVLYLVTSMIVGDFYKVPITVAFLASSAWALAITRRMPFRDRVSAFSRGASESNIMLMVWIFILAGAFAGSATDAGCIRATVDFSLQLLPDSLVPAGLFLGACFISLSIGTSVGTIVALVPVAVGIAQSTGADRAFLTAIVVGGAFFGDNLSFISDTTIAATRSQGCNMLDKFKTNLHIVLPAALAVLALYLFSGIEVAPGQLDGRSVEYVKILPYLVVLGTALAGMDVILVLALGIATTGVVGIATGSMDFFGWIASMGAGIAGMGELIIVTILAGGMLEMIRINGGIDYILSALTRRIRGRRGAEGTIAALVSLANLCTANNTIAIITVGPLAADIAGKYGVDPRKSASILDTFSCVVQGIIPYGAQLLMASTLSMLSPVDIIACLYYPLAVLVCAVLGIIIKRRRQRR